jgi:membrane protein YdbS with pleckstrin-like domain
VGSFKEDLKRLLREKYYYIPVVLILVAIVIAFDEVFVFGIFNPLWIFLNVIMVIVLFGIMAFGIIFHERLTGPKRG